MNLAERLEDVREASCEELLDLAEEHLVAGRLDTAEELFAAQSTRVAGAREATARALMGLAHCAAARECYHEALGHLQEAQSAAPHYPSLANDLGVVLYRLGLVEQARESLDSAVVDDEGHLEAWRNLLQVSLTLRNVDKCVQASQRILALCPGDPTARAIFEAAQDVEEGLRA